MVDITKFKALRNTRKPEDDVQYTTPSVLRKRLHTECKLQGCTNHISLYNGPGSRTLCREHQLLLREYGGFARLDRPWTFWKKDHCEECGHDPRTNPLVAEYEEPVRSVLARMLLDVDHIDGDRTNNQPSNLHTKCLECHSIKTFTEGDHWKTDFHSRRLKEK